MKVVAWMPVTEYARRLAPEQRRAVKQALRDLGEEKGDIRALEQNLSGYHRLRIGKLRLIFRYASASTIDAIFLEERSIVYEVFAEQFLSRLRQT